MDLFLVERPAGVIKDPALAWAPLVTGPIRVHAVAGTHQTMLEEPHVDVLAESLLKALRQGKKKHLGG
jgi:thioesterase domain-containing protein